MLIANDGGGIAARRHVTQPEVHRRPSAAPTIGTIGGAISGIGKVIGGAIHGATSGSHAIGGHAGHLHLSPGIGGVPHIGRHPRVGGGNYHVDGETGKIVNTLPPNDLVYRPGKHPGTHYELDPETGTIGLENDAQPAIWRDPDVGSKHPGSHYEVNPDTGKIELTRNGSGVELL